MPSRKGVAFETREDEEGSLSGKQRVDTTRNTHSQELFGLHFDIIKM